MNAHDSAAASAPPLKCTGCEQAMDTPVFCGNCHQLFPVESATYFELLGLPTEFELDVQDLRRRYLDLARSLHPDRFPGGSEELMRLSMRLSAQLNEAFRILADPVSRADYLLEVSGGPSSAADKTVPQAVLTETLMLREEIEEARAAGNEEALNSIHARIDEQREASIAEIVELARVLPADESHRRKLRAKLNTMKYYQRLLEQL